MATVIDVVRKVFPGASDSEADSLLWNHTGYPGFWRTGNPERDILHSLRCLKRTLDSGRQPCAFCNGVAKHPKQDPIECSRCSRALRKAAEAGRRA